MKLFYCILLFICSYFTTVEKGYSQEFYVPQDSITIPVVFHIVYRDSVEMVSLDDIYSQIDVLNEDFNAKNSDIVNVPEPFKKHIASANIKFCVQEIRYVKTNVRGFVYTPFFERLKFTYAGGSNVVEPDKFLNIYVCNLIGLVGQSQFPGLSKKTDAVIINYKYFGSIKQDSASYKNLGRTATHEVGHWLGLYHLWGNHKDDSKTDNCDDTPWQSKPTTGCPEFPVTDNLTKEYPGIMFNNFMDYTNDECALFFTKDQVKFMWDVLYTTRLSILENNK